MPLLPVFASSPKIFRGNGINEENEAFTGKLTIQMLEGNRAAFLRYTATLHNGTVVHTESSLLGTGPNGKLCLWPVMSEIPVILPHAEVLNQVGPSGELKVVFCQRPAQ